MGHHSNNYPFNQESPDFLKKLMEETGMKKTETKSDEKSLGATGQYPDGMIASNDEGGLQFGITVMHERIVIDFGKPIHSIGFTKDEAVNLANYLFEKARTLPNNQGH